MVRLDGSEGMINPLEIFATRTYDEEHPVYMTMDQSKI